MPDSLTNQLIALLGPENIRLDADALTRASGSWSPIATKRRQENAQETASVVALPGTTEEVAALVRWANESRTPLYVVGGGSNTSDSGARGGVAVDLARLDNAQWDEESLLVTVGAGRTLGSLEEDLNRHEYTLGSLPQSLTLATVGGAIATNAVGVLSGKYGRQDDQTASLTAVLANGSIVTGAPGARASFDLPGLFIGTEGQFGIVTEAVLRMRPVPEVRAFAPFTFARFEDAVDALRLVYRSDARPASARIFDATAAATLYARAEVAPAPFLLLLTFEGEELTQTGPYQLAYAVCQQTGGTIQSATLGDVWWDTRTQNDTWAPNARPGALADSIAVSAPWANLKAVAQAVRSALTPHVNRLGVQVSHATPHQAALEVSWQADAPDDSFASAQDTYDTITRAAYTACLNAGGSLFHHYAIGRARREGFEADRGAETLALWRTLKTTLDPNDILNPGVF